MARNRAQAVELPGVLQRDRDKRVYEFEVVGVRVAFVDLIRLLAYRSPLSPNQPMPIIIEHLSKRPLVDHGLLTLDAGSFPTLECLDELDALYRSPWLCLADQNPRAIEARFSERLEDDTQCPGVYRDYAPPFVGRISLSQSARPFGH